MTTNAALALVGLVAFAGSGAVMALRPGPYLGGGTAPVTSPRTIRWIGIAFLVSGSIALALTLIKFASE